MAQAKDLDPAEVEALREVAQPSLLKKPIPAKVQDRLIKMGYVEQKLGNLVATAKGEDLFSSSAQTAKKNMAS